MAWVGDGSVEIGEPAGATSPVRTFVERFGGGMHSIALQVDDIEAAKAHFAALGVAVATEPYPGMVWTRPADTAGVLMEWFALWSRIWTRRSACSREWASARTVERMHSSCSTRSRSPYR